MTPDDASASQGLPPRLRLRRPAEFRAVLSTRRAINQGGLRLAFLANDLGHARLGLAIAKRVLPRAVDRNRLKRLIRESFRHHRALLGGYDLVVLARQGVREHDNEQIRASLDHFWRRLSA